MAEVLEDRPGRRLGVAGHPYSALFLPVPIVCFVGALLTDVAYSNSGGNLQWLNFSTWLLATGLVFSFIAGLLMLIDLARLPQLRTSFGWGSLGLLVLSVAVEFINSLVHARDGWTAVVPAGLILSAIGAILIASYGWLWHESRYGPGVGP
jgi:uncharacterized membrane protein